MRSDLSTEPTTSLLSGQLRTVFRYAYLSGPPPPDLVPSA